ncbi:MAG: J domain-containing protein [Lachnospiraceae bacterium]
MNIWSILEITSTTDKKTIKRAYARLLKLCHPEEKPEEFKRLYEAYQAALAYAEGTARQNDINVPPPEVPFVPRQTEEPENPLEEDFGKAFEEAEDKRSIFIRKWKYFYQNRKDSEEYQKWLDYLDSKEFREIRMEEGVINEIINTFNFEWFPEGGIYEEIWHRYGFKESEKDSYQDEIGELYKCLAAKIHRVRQDEYIKQKEEKQSRNQRSRNKWIFGLFVVTVVLIAFGIPISAYYSSKKFHHAVETYLSETYPHTEFTVSEGWRSGGDGYRGYTCFSEEYPNVAVTVWGEKSAYHNGYDMSDDYREKIYPLYAEKYGLECSWYWEQTITDGVMVFYYPGIGEGELEQFLEQCRVFLESEEAHQLGYPFKCSFAPRGALFPRVIIDGNSAKLPEGLIGMSDALPGDQELIKAIKESYIAYMYSYESWNVTTDLTEQYLQIYVNRFPNYINRIAITEPMNASAHIEMISQQNGFPLYTLWYYHKSQYCISVGNLYNYLRFCQADVRLSPDGNGFTVYKDGQGYIFGLNGESYEVEINFAHSLVQ